MAPAPAPAGGGLDLKRLPPWAWGVAIAGGAVVGFLLLKPKAGEPESGDEEAASEGGRGRTSGETAVVQPISEAELQALGLSQGPYYGPQYGDSGSGGSSGDGVGGDGVGGDGVAAASAESGVFHPVSSGLSYLSGPSSPTSSGISYLSGPSSPTSSGYSAPTGPSSPVSSGIVYSPTAPTGGGGKILAQ